MAWEERDVGFDDVGVMVVVVEDEEGRLDPAAMQRLRSLGSVAAAGEMGVGAGGVHLGHGQSKRSRAVLSCGGEGGPMTVDVDEAAVLAVT